MSNLNLNLWDGAERVPVRWNGLKARKGGEYASESEEEVRGEEGKAAGAGSGQEVRVAAGDPGGQVGIRGEGGRGTWGGGWGSVGKAAGDPG
jgi:hypothetical protein